MPDMFNPDFNAPEIQEAIDVISAQKTAEVVDYFRNVAKVAVLSAMPEGEKIAADAMTKIASGPLPGAMLASVMMHEASSNKEATLQGAAEVSALRNRLA
jgi:hypothetical protein